METIEKRLKDIEGCQVWKVTDNKGTRHETTTYMLNTADGDNINCFGSLAELKAYVKNVGV